MVRGGLGLSRRAEDAVEPLLPHGLPRLVLQARRLGERIGEGVEVDVLPRGAAPYRVGISGELGIESFGLLHQPVPRAVEASRRVRRQVPQLFARRVVFEDRELRLRGSKRERVSAKLDALGEEGVLELVGLLDELAGDQAPGRRLAEAVEALARLAPGLLLRLLERVVLLAREEIRVALDDRGLLARLLLADPDRPALLGALVQISRELRLEFVRCPDNHHRTPHGLV